MWEINSLTGCQAPASLVPYRQRSKGNTGNARVIKLTDWEEIWRAREKLANLQSSYAQSIALCSDIGLSEGQACAIIELRVWNIYTYERLCI